MRRVLLVLSLLMLPLLWAPTVTQAVEPDEMLDDPALEFRARALSRGLRCLVCRNESIDESNAPLARDLRVLVRERLVAGDTDAAVMQYVVSRYGEYVLLRPVMTGANWLLWAAGPLMLLVAGGLGLGFIRRRSRATGARALSPGEQARLARLLDKNSQD